MRRIATFLLLGALLAAAGLCDGSTTATAEIESELRAGTDASGPPTAALAAGALVLVLGGALLLRRRRTVR